MGVLDSIFSGSSGVSKLVHNLLGGTAILRVVKTRVVDDDTRRIKPQEYMDFEVSFVPDNISKPTNNLSNNAVSTVTTISGTFPATDITNELSLTPKAGRDYLIVDNITYKIESLDVVRVGDSTVQYSVSCKRLQ